MTLLAETSKLPSPPPSAAATATANSKKQIMATKAGPHYPHRPLGHRHSRPTRIPRQLIPATPRTVLLLLSTASLFMSPTTTAAPSARPANHNQPPSLLPSPSPSQTPASYPSASPPAASFPGNMYDTPIRAVASGLVVGVAGTAVAWMALLVVWCCARLALAGYVWGVIWLSGGHGGRRRYVARRTTRQGEEVGFR